MTESELIRLAIASFLSKESAIAEYLEALDSLDKRLAVITARQEQFARAVGFAALSAEVEKNATTRAGFADKITKIVETVF